MGQELAPQRATQWSPAAQTPGTVGPGAEHGACDGFGGPSATCGRVGSPRARYMLRRTFCGADSYLGSDRNTTAGTTNMFRAVDDTSPQTMTTASGA